ncbi:MAG: NADH-quinone oxidoreductase subunit N [Chloroflexi bacterium]|nr:NADH-quinone oxidoreductase subunit N [Chloroflexota bacterium]
MAPAQVDFVPLIPTIVVTVTALAVLLLGLWLRGEQGIWLAAVSIAGLVAALVFLLGLAGPAVSERRAAFDGMIVADNLSTFFGAVALVIAILTILLSEHVLLIERFSQGEYYALVLLTTVGMLVLTAATDLIVLILGLEILSISLYVLTGFARGRLGSEEAALKYFLLGAFALGFLVYGSALVYGATGTTTFGQIANVLRAPGASSPLLLIGLGLLLVGFGFKLSFVPFHMWTPDVYEGAPSAVTGFMAVGTKAAVFGSLLRILTEAFPALRAEWAAVLWLLAILTMILGNFAAIAQRNVKRMLAYSSIAQAGYIVLAVIAADPLGRAGVMFYVLAYTFMNLGAFAVVVAVADRGDVGTTLDHYVGLARRSPILALAMGVFMLSLAGVPPTAGFMAKLFVFTAAVRAGYVDLAIIGVLTSAVATFYYLRVIVAMYMSAPAEEPAPAPALRVPGPLLALLVIALVATFGLGIFPAVTGDLVGGTLALAK